MHVVPQGCRPKHQVLILKCYPKFQKSKLEVKPNSSELSYLLYYASTRRSKLPKVGAFLEKKTARDVNKSRIGNVQVTLQILRSLIEKCSRELPLFAAYVLRMLDTIISSRDINLVEESIPVFETFCAHRDSATLSADEAYTRQYDEVAKAYISFASKDTPIKTKDTKSVPVSIRFRKAGLQAIKSIISSESLLLETNRQLRVIIPVILQNLYSEKRNYMFVLQQREQAQEKFEKDQSIRRRQSVSIGRTNDTSEIDPSTAAGTTADLDERADEEVGVLALQSLRLIFSANNRGQLRSSTHAVLSFVAARTSTQKGLHSDSSWYTGLFETVCQWTPVQDRFIVLVVVMENLIRSPIVEKDLSKQLVTTKIVRWLLRSNIIFIGLSVMDVLVGLIQHTLLLLQLGGEGARLFPHRQQVLALNEKEEIKEGERNESISDNLSDPVVMEIVKEPSSTRKTMLQELEDCIGDLATHIYYSDQISDMVSALLSRLTPSSVAGSSTAASAIEDPVHAKDAIAASINLQERPHIDSFFSFDNARTLALRAVKLILSVANIHPSTGNTVVRNRVGVSVWDGTQWMLRDPDGSVRKAYADALLTWLHLEMDKVDARVVENQIIPLTYARKDPDQSTNGNKLARRAVSNASQRAKTKKPSTSSFLQLIHLAIYENALQYAESEPDILLLHLLSTSLVQELGINSVRYGLPMVFCLQEDISTLDSVTAQKFVSSFVHGYFWAVIESFDLEATPVGTELQNEMSRRTELNIWLNKVRVPAVSLEDLEAPSNLGSLPSGNHDASQMEPLRPFESRSALVESIAEAYSEMPLSPPSSPPLSPSRRFSISTVNTTKMPPTPPRTQRKFPERVKEQMLAEWTKDICIVAAGRAETKATSLGGSKAGTGSGNRNFLSVDGLPSAQNGTRTPSPKRDLQESRNGAPSATFGLTGGGRGALQEIFRQRSRGSSPIRISNSSSQSVMRVKELKKALSGTYGVPPTEQSNEILHDNESDSMVSADVSVSESSPTRPQFINGITREHPRPRSSGSSRSPPLRPSNDAADIDIPPVPPLPPTLHITAETPLSDDIGKQLGNTKFDGFAPVHKGVELSKARPSLEDSLGSLNGLPSGPRNLDDLLSGIDTSGRRPGSSMGRPPY